MQNQDTPPLSSVNIDLPQPSDIEPSIEFQHGDDQLYETATQIARTTADFDWYCQWMVEYNKTRCKPPWPAGRVARYIRKVWREVHGDEEGSIVYVPIDDLPRAKHTRVSFKRLDDLAFTAKGMYEELLAFLGTREAIPSTEAIIDRLYPKNPLICRAAKWQGHAGTGNRESIRGCEHLFEWIVPSPMAKLTGVTKEGRPRSPRCRDNAGPLKYLVIEFDFTKAFQKHIDAWAAAGISTRDVQARLIHWLATEGEPRSWPFMIVDSGGKSLHSWYSIRRRFTRQNALDLLSRAIPLGADYHAEEPEHFFRFPGGTRSSDKSQPQPVLFYDQKRLV